MSSIQCDRIPTPGRFCGGCMWAICTYFPHGKNLDRECHNGRYEELQGLLAFCMPHASFLLGLFYESEDGGDVFLRNVA
jgi:hypothetical protein